MTAPHDLKRVRFDQLYQSNQKRFARIALTYAGKEHQQDLLQDIWHQLWRSLDNFALGSKADTWAYRVALNTAISFVRKDSKQNRVQDSVSALEPIQSASMSEAMFLVLQFMASLSDIDKAAFLMYLDGFNHSQIAGTLAISNTNVAVKINRMKSKFEQMYLE